MLACGSHHLALLLEAKLGAGLKSVWHQLVELVSRISYPAGLLMVGKAHVSCLSESSVFIPLPVKRTSLSESVREGCGSVGSATLKSVGWL